MAALRKYLQVQLQPQHPTAESLDVIFGRGDSSLAVIVENKPSTNGMIAASGVAGGDDHTILSTMSSIVRTCGCTKSPSYKRPNLLPVAPLGRLPWCKSSLPPSTKKPQTGSITFVMIQRCRRGVVALLPH